MTEAGWTHRTCRKCAKRNHATVMRLVSASPGFCCHCGGSTRLGLYFRAEPLDVPCSGAHTFFREAMAMADADWRRRQKRQPK